jgi:hypothetical protein
MIELYDRNDQYYMGFLDRLFPPVGICHYRSTAMSSPTASSRGLNVALWSAQLLVGAPFIAFGVMKITMPIAQLATSMPWVGEVPVSMARGLGLVDLAGGVGLILPALTGIRPDLTRLAAVGSILLQLCAIVFHVMRGEGAVVPLNAALLLLLCFILWGRTTRAPLTDRRGASS